MEHVLGEGPGEETAQERAALVADRADAVSALTWIGVLGSLGVALAMSLSRRLRKNTMSVDGRPHVDDGVVARHRWRR